MSASSLLLSVVPVSSLLVVVVSVVSVMLEGEGEMVLVMLGTSDTTDPAGAEGSAWSETPGSLAGLVAPPVFSIHFCISEISLVTILQLLVL